MTPSAPFLCSRITHGHWPVGGGRWSRQYWPGESPFSESSSNSTSSPASSSPCFSSAFSGTFSSLLFSGPVSDVAVPALSDAPLPAASSALALAGACELFCWEVFCAIIASIRCFSCSGGSFIRIRSRASFSVFPYPLYFTRYLKGCSLSSGNRSISLTSHGYQTLSAVYCPQHVVPRSSISDSGGSGTICDDARSIAFFTSD
mmetsp:Transcript_5872/g.14245  ORF Transcript_5872/g.14245 Transcript_5872/m.14245 type:complete len:203 (+) Transcript_5872:1429-2037(+)